MAAMLRTTKSSPGRALKIVAGSEREFAAGDDKRLGLLPVAGQLDIALMLRLPAAAAKGLIARDQSAHAVVTLQGSSSRPKLRNPQFSWQKLVPEENELSTYPLPRGCATTTLLRRPAGGGARAGRYSPSAWPRERPCLRTFTASIMPKSDAKSGNRRDRLADALRENLRRRKARARPAESGESNPADIAEKNSEPAQAERPNPAAKTI